MTQAEEEEWERNRKEMNEVYEKLNKLTNIKKGITYICLKSFSLPEPFTGCWNVFTKGNKYYCYCPDQLVDDHNCGTVIPKDYQKYFAPFEND